MFQRCSVGTKEPKLQMLQNLHQQLDLLTQAWMESCFVFNVVAQIETRQTYIFFQSSIVQFWRVCVTKASVSFLGTRCGLLLLWPMCNSSFDMLSSEILLAYFELLSVFLSVVFLSA